MRFVMNRATSKLVGQIVNSMYTSLYRDIEGKTHIIQNSRHRAVEIDIEELELISWEHGIDDHGNTGPDLDDLGRIVNLGYRSFWYVDFGTDMVNVLCAKNDEVARDLDNDERSLIGRAVWEHLTS